MPKKDSIWLLEDQRYLIQTRLDNSTATWSEITELFNRGRAKTRSEDSVKWKYAALLRTPLHAEVVASRDLVSHFHHIAGAQLTRFESHGVTPDPVPEDIPSWDYDLEGYGALLLEAALQRQMELEIAAAEATASASGQGVWFELSDRGNNRR